MRSANSSLQLCECLSYDFWLRPRREARFPLIRRAQVFFYDQRLVIELDSPLMFTLVSLQRSRKAEEK